jgi:hypothetical protein
MYKMPLPNPGRRLYEQEKDLLLSMLRQRRYLSLPGEAN